MGGTKLGSEIVSNNKLLLAGQEWGWDWSFIMRQSRRQSHRRAARKNCKEEQIRGKFHLI